MYNTKKQEKKMKKQLFIGMLGIATMLASCSQDEETALDMNGAATFTVTLDEGMRTRAVTDEDENTGLSLAAFVIDEGNNIVHVSGNKSSETTAEGNILYTFTVSGLQTTGKYRIVCWVYPPLGYMIDEKAKRLIMVEGTDSPAIAYYGSTGTEALTLEEMDKSISMKHAVGRLTLVTTKSLVEGRSVQLKVPTYTAFDLLTGSVLTGDATPAATATATSEASVQLPDGAAEVALCSVYVLCGEAVTNGVTVTTYDGEIRRAWKSFDNVPVKPDQHVLLKGDANLGVSGSIDFTAEIATTWNSDTSAGDLDGEGF